MSLYVKTGSYVGNATASRAITGIGFQPKLLFIRGDNGVGASQGVWTMDLVAAAGGTFAFDAAQNIGTTRLDSIDADGFTLGTATSGTNGLNNSGLTYYYLAIGGTPDSIQTGTYTGDGADNRDVVTGLPFQPDMVLVRGASVATSSVRTKTTPAGDNTVSFSASAMSINIIQAINSDGFQVGTASRANSNGTTYYWFALKEDNIALAFGSYTGTGSATSVTSAPFQPTAVLGIRQPTGFGAWKTQDMSTLSFEYSTAAALSDAILALTADGFDLGADVQVNENTIPYHWVAFKDAAPPPEPPSSGDDINKYLMTMKIQ